MPIEQPDEQDDKPLDPVMENVRRKMVRLQLVSAGVMLVMLMAVLGTIVYKVTRPSPGAVARAGGLAVPGEAPLTAVAALPAGFSINDVALSGNQILFFGTLIGGRQKAIVFDIAAGRIVADVDVAN
ncbi:hypothetical protein [Pararhizobium sp.]|uniref:hypothetical protein n=1 Tax=Pararhizobium sp. TaxID=1977563 RepID=UPI002725D233|nr:hypothetical protein [Pararhizobium sp.]MDO9415089.1 hypothetical protein [Pararhizobium sp.]